MSWRISNPPKGTIVSAQIEMNGVNVEILGMHNGSYWLVQNGNGSFEKINFAVKRWRDVSMEILKFVN